MPFIRVSLTSDTQSLADAAVQRLVDQWPDWTPDDADLEVIQIETIAPMAQNTAEVASIVPDAIFRAYGTKLLGLPYLTGAPARGVATFTALDAVGYDSQIPVEIALQGMAFTTDSPVVIPAGQDSVDAPITCSTDGNDGNGLFGSADLTTAVPWIDMVVVNAATAGGVDPEGDPAYQDRLSDRLQLQATTLVAGRDFELMAVQQPGIGRALAIVGQARQVTVAVTNEVGLNVAGPDKDLLAELYDGYRQVNTNYSIIDATRTPIDVTFTLVALPGQDPVDLHDRAVAAVQEWLDPMAWGRPQNVSDTSIWQQSTIVRYNELIRVVSVFGTAYVKAATLNGGTADVNLPGVAPLTTPGSITGGVE